MLTPIFLIAAEFVVSKCSQQAPKKLAPQKLLISQARYDKWKFYEKSQK